MKSLIQAKRQTQTTDECMSYCGLYYNGKMFSGFQITSRRFVLGVTSDILSAIMFIITENQHQMKYERRYALRSDMWKLWEKKGCV